jgi:serine/threonine-protein kinase HipA
MDSRGVWKLSPAYDITYAYGTDYTRVHQLSLKGKTTDFTQDDLLQIAKTHSIDPKSAAAWIEKIKEVLSAFPDRAKALDIHQKTIERVAGSHRLGV